ncbi:GGDEF family protein [Marinomonas sp. MED121]|uniref:diguanylate cyclase domain-containing protein n=1 Tax=Marinomonas sp. MED121 TaxID=314277 RepID=UPI0000690B6C|nr:diguanylate cyclase [Marinomonas sp. MED121]EAQ66063.1 GGDEF family protein [Marinomonas sp. MED121]
MNRLKRLTLRAKLIIAFCTIASFTLVSSGTAIYLFQLYQSKLAFLSKTQGEPLIIAAHVIEDLQVIRIDLERIRGTNDLSLALISIDEINTQWHHIKKDLNTIKSLNPSLMKLYADQPDAIDLLLASLPTFTTITSLLNKHTRQSDIIHDDIFKEQQNLLDRYSAEIDKIRIIQHVESNQLVSEELNRLTDLERRINQINAFLLEALNTKSNQELSLLARKSLKKLREIEQLNLETNQYIQEHTLNWINHIRPYVASSISIFQQGKQKIRLKRILNTHIEEHISTIDDLNTSSNQNAIFLKNAIIQSSHQLTQDVAFANKLLIALTIICIICVFLIIWLFVSQRIIRPFIETSQSMQLLAQGETRIPLPTSDDKEVKKMLQSLKVLQQYVIKVNNMADRDSLTDLYNRRYFDKLLTQTIKEKSEIQHISLLMCDLDHFKPYNDYYGHQQGDDCLKFFAKILKRLSDKTSDHVCRYGGEEFAIIILDKSAHYAESLAQLICNETSKALIPHINSDCADVVTVSVGAANVNIDALEDANQLINLADQALYQAKNNGRNCVLIN